MAKVSYLLIFLTIIILSLLSMGCILQEPSEGGSFSAIPSIKMDYNDKEMLTTIWVGSAFGYEYKYDTIMVEISWGNIRNINIMNYTYCIVTQTHLFKFYINVTTDIEGDEYFYSGLVEIYPDNDHILSVTRLGDENNEPEEELIRETDLPWKDLLRKRD
jgi:hypothetical protein